MQKTRPELTGSLVTFCGRDDDPFPSMIRSPPAPSGCYCVFTARDTRPIWSTRIMSLAEMDRIDGL